MFLLLEQLLIKVISKVEFITLHHLELLESQQQVKRLPLLVEMLLTHKQLTGLRDKKSY